MTGRHIHRPRGPWRGPRFQVSWLIWPFLVVVACRSTPALEHGSGSVGASRGACSQGLDPAEGCALEMALTEHVGDRPIDARIRALQARARGSMVLAADLERLGWAHIARARELGDAGSYNMAGLCARAIEEHAPGNHGGMLLAGHVLHSLHRFSEAETMAQRLVSERGLSFDYGLLGDVLIDRGQVDAGIEAYQRMVEMRPDAHAYARAAHARYLRGDPRGAAEAMGMAARAVSARNHETFAWTWAHLARYQLQLGEVDAALSAAQRALEVSPGSRYALLEKARALVAQGSLAAALAPLRKAAADAPHPNVLWLFADVLEDTGLVVEAAGVRHRIEGRGEGEDPRSLVLYLASRGRSLERARRLIEREFQQRQDIYTHEARAWLQSALGQHRAALESARLSLAEGTADPRLWYHAGAVAARADEPELALTWLRSAAPLAHTLLPSQQQRLHRLLMQLAQLDRRHRLHSKAQDVEQHASSFIAEKGDTQ